LSENLEKGRRRWLGNLDGLQLAVRWLRFQAWTRPLGRAPAVLLAAVTHRCTLSCPFCGIPATEMDERGTSWWRGLLQEASASGVVSVSFCGGEPLVRPDIAELVEVAAGAGLRVSLTTSGCGFDDWADGLEGLDGLTVSLDGPREVHDRLRGRGGHQQAMAAIRWGLGRGKAVYSATVVSRLNRDVVPHVCKQAREQGFLPFFQPATEYGLGGANPEDWALTRPELVRLADELLERRAAGDPIGNSDVAIRRLRRIGEGGSAIACTAGRTFLTVLPDGRFVPCHVHSHGPVFEPGRFESVFGRSTSPPCDGCAIAPYVEYDRVLGRLNVEALRDAWATLVSRTGR